MVCCHLESDTERKDWVVVRVFGEEGEYDRDNEVMGLQLAYAAKCGTPVLGIFTNGVIVGFFPGRTIKYDDLFDHKVMR